MTAHRDTLLILALTALALLLRLWGINTDLWLDEIATVVDYMRQPPLEAATTFKSANQHLLNNLLGSISIRVFGESAWAVRLPALIFGVATIPAFFGLARAVTERREALLATLFMTLSYHHLWFSQNARGYTAMIFFAVLSTLLLVRWLGNGTGRGGRDWLWFALCSGLGMLSLLNYAFVLAGQFSTALVLLVGTRNWSRIPVLATSGVLIVVLTALGYAATLPAMIDYFSNGGAEMGWQNPLTFVRVFTSGLISALPAMALPALAAGGVIAVTGWVSYLKRQPVVGLMLVLPAAFNIAALVLLDFGAYPRAFLYILPFGILVLMRGAFALGGLARRAVPRLRDAYRIDYLLPVVLLAGAVVMLPYNYRYPKQDYTGSLAYARAQAAPDDIIAAVGYLATGYKIYYAPDLAFPENAEALDALREPGRRVWLLYAFTRDLRRHFPNIQDYIETELQLQRVFPGTLGDGTIYLAVSPAAR